MLSLLEKGSILLLLIGIKKKMAITASALCFHALKKGAVRFSSSADLFFSA